MDMDKKNDVMPVHLNRHVNFKNVWFTSGQQHPLITFERPTFYQCIYAFNAYEWGLITCSAIIPTLISFKNIGIDQNQSSSANR